jgi:YidC/Oxa1 family membrane protein insertase
MFSILGVPVDAAYHLVAGFTGILTPVLGGAAAVAAIIAFTMTVRLILMPLSLRALRGQAAMARLAPELLALRQRYARQPDRLQAEMTALYRREGTSMFAGITPVLLQWPFVSVLYLLFCSSRVGGAPNTLLTHDLLGVPLGAHWLAGAGPASPQGAVFLGVFALLGVLGWLSVRLARRAARQAAAQPALARVLPYLTVVVAAFVPLAAAIYLFTSTAWSLAERMFFWRSASGPNRRLNSADPAHEARKPLRKAPPAAQEAPPAAQVAPPAAQEAPPVP